STRTRARHASPLQSTVCAGIEDRTGCAHEYPPGGRDPGRPLGPDKGEARLAPTIHRLRWDRGPGRLPPGTSTPGGGPGSARWTRTRARHASPLQSTVCAGIEDRSGCAREHPPGGPDPERPLGPDEGEARLAPTIHRPRWDRGPVRRAREHAPGGRDPERPLGPDEGEARLAPTEQTKERPVLGTGRPRNGYPGATLLPTSGSP